MNEPVPWFIVTNTSQVSSPAILIFPDRIEQNISKMIEIAGTPERLRPHVKTHKMPELVRLQVKHGITRFKTSTIAETEMVAACGVKDILLAMQPVGPNLERLFSLKEKFGNTIISCLADNEKDIDLISGISVRSGIETPVWLDINSGMNRTGIIPGKEAAGLFKRIGNSPMLIPAGLHVYDGHIHEPDEDLRRNLSAEAFAPVSELISMLQADGFKNIKIVAGGTPSFPLHARHGNAELSPGTLLLWDSGYSQAFRDLDFMHAAVLLTRVVSKPSPGLLCLDLGHKAVASEMTHPRVVFPELSDYSFVSHNEEHLVIRTGEAERFNTGDVLYGIPWHICPTIDRYDKATVIRNHMAVEEWEIEARKRRITI